MSLLHIRKAQSLTREFAVYAAIILFTVMTLTVLSSWYTYSEQKSRILERLDSAASRVERSLDYSLKYSEYILSYILTQMNHKWDDYPYIDNLLSTLKVDQEVNTILSWNMFSWTNQYHQIVVNSLYHILKKPIDASSMSNMADTMTEPGVLQIGKPTIGGVSGQLIIPASIGAVDEDGRYIGAIGTGFNIDGIVSKLRDVIDMDYITFMIVDEQLDPIITTNNHSSFIPLLAQLKKIPLDKQPSGILTQFSLLNNSAYSIYRKIPDTPFTAIFRYDPVISNQEIWGSIAAKLAQFMLSGSVILLLLYLLYLRIISPIAQLSVSADAISQGKKNFAIPYSPHYEISNLGNKLRHIEKYITTIEDVKDKLETQSEELIIAKDKAETARLRVKKLNKELEKRVSQRTFELEKALSARQEFLNNISHEIRVPIQCVVGFSEGLEFGWDRLNNDARLQTIHKIKDSAYRLLDLVTNLLDLSKFGTGKMTFDMHPYDLKLLLDVAVQECEPQLREKPDLHFVTQIAPEISTTVICDQVRLSQVLRNLLNNAIKFTASGTITLSLTSKKLTYDDGSEVPGLNFSITDEGIGIPKNELHDIFTAFTQSSKTLSGAGGTGLGLSICYEIIHAHHGIIWAENNQSSVGSTFHFIIPAMTETIVS